MPEPAGRPNLTLINGGDLLPLGEPGGVSFPLSHTPGTRRPFAAGLATPMPVTVRHATTSTSPRTSMGTSRSDDGKVYPDTTSDTGSDS